MSRFHVHRLKIGDGLVMDLQEDFLDGLETRVVAPLMSVDKVGATFVRLSPRFQIGDQAYIIVIPSMAAVPKQALGECCCRFFLDAR